MVPSTFRLTVLQQALQKLAGGIGGGEAAVLRFYLLYVLFPVMGESREGFGCLRRPDVCSARSYPESTALVFVSYVHERGGSFGCNFPATAQEWSVKWRGMRFSVVLVRLVLVYVLPALDACVLLHGGIFVCCRFFFLRRLCCVHEKCGSGCCCVGCTWRLSLFACCNHCASFRAWGLMIGRATQVFASVLSDHRVCVFSLFSLMACTIWRARRLLYYWGGSFLCR